MSDNLRQRVRRIFLAVADLPEEQLQTALDRACGADAELRAEVEALLGAERAAGDFLANPTAGAEARPADPAASLAADARASEPQPSGLATPESATPELATFETAGAQIGRYKLLEQIGEGGMGTIWMAEQREPVKRRVALKIIKLGMDTKLVIARFEAERQALAMMDHPNIAKVLDAGTTDAGRPYFVMEYIRGIPILEYCDKEKVDTKARLQLFTDVCHAIQHAHQKGIIHRDIKPDNVLVTLHDGVPVVKVIDFGIAKATNQELTQKTLFTEHRQMIGTPAYMSPEQAEMSGLDIDTRSDVYSLGVLLYEMLTGTTPFDMKQLLEGGFAEMMRTIREIEPHKPSTRVSSLGDTGTRTAMERRVDVKRLGSLLRGDLDWIVMKCLEKDRARRYETANSLAADVLRHLNDEAVSAGAPSPAYRLRKFVRRNKVQVVAAAAVAIALVAGIIGFAWQASVAEDQRAEAVRARESEAEQRKLADASRDEARKQAELAKARATETAEHAAVAKAIADFQSEMLTAANPLKLRGDKVTVLQAMESALELLQNGSLADAPRVEASVRNTIGDTLRSLGRPDEAEQCLRRAMAIGREHFAAGDPTITESVWRLAEVLELKEQFAEAEPLYLEAVEAWRQQQPARPLALASCLLDFGVMRFKQRRFDDGEQLVRESLGLRRAHLPAGDPEIATCLHALGQQQRVQGNLREAESIAREVLDMRRAALPAGHPLIGGSYSMLAAVLQGQGRLAEAEPHQLAAQEIYAKAYPEGHPTIAFGWLNFGVMLSEQGKFEQALPVFDKAIQTFEATYGRQHFQTLTAVGNLGTGYLSCGKVKEAVPLLEEVYEASKTEPRLAWVTKGLIDAHRKLIDANDPQAYAAFRTRMQAFLADDRSLHPDGSPEQGDILFALGFQALARSDLDEASKQLAACVDMRHRVRPAHWQTHQARALHGYVLTLAKEFSEAEPHLLAGCRGMIEAESSMPPGARFFVPMALQWIVEHYQKVENSTEAEVWQGKLDAARARQAKAVGEGK